MSGRASSHQLRALRTHLINYSITTAGGTLGHGWDEVLSSACDQLQTLEELRQKVEQRDKLDAAIKAALA